MTTSTEVAGRLRRIEGQIAGVRKMYEEARCCTDVLDQLSAARAGLAATALLILEEQVDTCLSTAISDGDRAEADEVLASVRRFARSV